MAGEVASRLLALDREGEVATPGRSDEHIDAGCAADGLAEATSERLVIGAGLGRCRSAGSWRAGLAGGGFELAF